ncbi:hypothetical protein AVEN_44322-1 [Araneus ventricosus]|uniref:Integrase catalytic domain-containing protein n=1 Tax=Araneus ventricosus TaxID=182803 RepID=A0A4Y2PI19_ARAVE|nr:hypothetical protein AVEN_44322-1 [Araneus ventricosus]
MVNFYRFFIPHAALQQAEIYDLVKNREKNESKPKEISGTKLTPTETRYNTYDRELLAVCRAIKHLAYILEGREFTVYTDQKPMTFMLHQKHDKISPRQQRHLDFISQFTTDIRFISGSDNFVSDAFSRIREIQIPNEINYADMEEAQRMDKELEELKKDSSLSFKTIEFPVSNLPLYCDVSSGQVRPYVPETFRLVIFHSVHDLAHSGCKATIDAVRRSGRFSHVNIDNVGPLPLCCGFNFLLTCVDRFTRWPEAFPLQNKSPSTVAEAFFSGWISRFGVPDSITTDQGRNLESDLFHALAKCLGIRKQRTSAYHPAVNGIVERFHRKSNAALNGFILVPPVGLVFPAVNNGKSDVSQPNRGYQNLGTSVVLNQVKSSKTTNNILGIRTSLKMYIGSSAAELVYGTNPRLHEEFFSSVSGPKIHQEFLTTLREHFREIQPKQTSDHSGRLFSVHRNLSNASHVFVRQDMVKRTLRQPYDGPFTVLARKPKFFQLQIGLQKKWISTDRLKPAHMLPDPTTESCPFRSFPVSSRTTRSGRHMRFRLPISSCRLEGESCGRRERTSPSTRIEVK